MNQTDRTGHRPRRRPLQLGGALLVCFLGFVPAVHAQGFSGSFALGIDEVLASDSLEGRKTGWPGGRKAEEFAASLLRQWGLQPGGADGTYFQPYDLITTQVNGLPDLTYLGAPPGDLTYGYGADYVVMLYSGFGDATGGVVFVGYGISTPEKGHDDYAGIDVRGKIVLVMRGAPSRGGPWDEERQSGYKSRTARRRGAAGMLLFEGDRPLMGTLQEKFFEPELPVASVGLRVVRDLLVGTGRGLGDLRTAAGAGKFVSFAMDRRVHLSIAGQVLNPGHARNVIARIPGSDPELRKECVIEGAHLDHLGRDGLGRIYPGADDNASGASVILEMAHVLSTSTWHPKRTVYLALFTAEEQGLRGSTYMAEHPPAESIAVMLNMDMVGLGDPVPDLNGADRSPDLARLGRSLLPDSMRAKSGGGGTGANSDQWPFSERAIPSLFLASHGEHPDYHDVEDKSWKIRPDVLQAVGDFQMRILHVVADTSAFRADDTRMARFVTRLGRPVARARWDEGLRGLHEAAGRGAGIVLLSLPLAEPLELDARLARMKREFADSSLYRLAFSPDDFDGHAGAGKVSVVLECRVGSFDLADSVLLGFLQREGVRGVVPDAAPSAAEARRIVSAGLLLDEVELKKPQAFDGPVLVTAPGAPGTPHAFEFVAAGALKPDQRQQGLLLGPEPAWRTGRALLGRNWTRMQIQDCLSGSFTRHWRTALESAR